MAAAPRETVLERVRRRAQEEQAAKHLDVPVPGYGGDLVVRLAPIGWDTTAEIGERNHALAAASAKAGRTVSRAQWNTLADLVIRGVSDVMLNVDGHLVPLREEGSTGLTRELGEALGWPTVPDTARQILLTLFARANSPELHVTSVAVRYQEWLEDADQVVVEAVLGE